MPPLAVPAAKAVRARGRGAAALRRACAPSGAAFFALFATDDQREGMRAFIEKRPPTWTGR